jgi:hypothetical protein
MNHPLYKTNIKAQAKNMKIVSIPEPVNDGIRLVIHEGNDMKKVIAKIITNAKPYLRNNPIDSLLFPYISENYYYYQNDNYEHKI